MDYDAAFLNNCWIFIYNDNMAVDMQICDLLTRIQCKVSDTQVTVKACGPLVSQVSDVVHGHLVLIGN